MCVCAESNRTRATVRCALGARRGVAEGGGAAWCVSGVSWLVGSCGVWDARAAGAPCPVAQRLPSAAWSLKFLHPICFDLRSFGSAWLHFV